jgi:pimeloyl-ACP methyl ester carboxylesterase
MPNLDISWSGSGESTIFLVPGLAAGTWIYGLVEEALSKWSRVGTVAIVQSDPSEGHAQPFPASTILALQVAIEEQHGPVYIVAHSLGGALAIAAAENGPRNLGGLVILDAGPKFVPEDQLPGEVSKILATADELFPLTDDSGAERMNAWVAEMASPIFVDRLLDDFRRASRPFIREFFIQGRLLQLQLDPRKVSVPVLVMVACETDEQCDGFMAEFEQRWSGAPNANVVAVRNSRHFIMLDQPEETARLIRDFVTACPPLNGHDTASVAAISGQGCQIRAEGFGRVQR